MEWQQPLARFPDRFSAVFVRDLRQTLRSPFVVASLLVLQIAVLGFTGFELFLFSLTGGNEAGTFLSSILSVFLTVGFGLLLPLTGLGALQPKLGTGKNVELLTTSSLTRWQIVRGKWMTMTVFSSLLLSSLAPFLTVRYFLGNVDLPTVGLLFVSTLATNAVMNAIVIGASGFNNYLARGVTIAFLGIVYLSSTSLSFASMAGFARIPHFPILSWFCIALSAGVIAILALQLGRARLKLFSTIHSPPATGGIFIMARMLPLIQGIGWSAGGKITLLILTLLWFALAFLIDRSPRTSYR